MADVENWIRHMAGLMRIKMYAESHDALCRGAEVEQEECRGDYDDYYEKGDEDQEDSGEHKGEWDRIGERRFLKRDRG